MTGWEIAFLAKIQWEKESSLWKKEPRLSRRKPPGIGAVATTFVAGVYAVRKGDGKPIGSLTQMGTIRLGKRTDKRVPLIKDFVSLSGLDDLVFGGWDIFKDDMYAAAVNAGVLDRATSLKF